MMTAASSWTWTTSASITPSDQTYNRKFAALFGPPRSPEAYFFTERSGYPSYFGDEALQLQPTVPGESALRRYRRQYPGGDRGGGAQPGAPGPSRDRVEESVHGGRRGAQQRGQRPGAARNAFRGALHPARRRRCGRGVGRRPVRLSHRAGSAALLRDGACLLGRGAQRGANRGVSEVQRDCLRALRQRRGVDRALRGEPGGGSGARAGSRGASSGDRGRWATAASSPTRAART